MVQEERRGERARSAAPVDGEPIRPARVERRRHRAWSKWRLLERREWLDELAQTFHERSPLGPLIIEGEPGLGKTALVNAACYLAAQEGMLVLRARGSTRERAVPFGVARQLFERQPLGAVDASEREVDDDAWAADVPDGGSGADGRQFGAGAPTSHDTLRALQDRLSTLASRQPLLVAVDDLQWADVPSLEWLHYLARRMRPGRMWLVGSTVPHLPWSDVGPVGEIMQEPSTRILSLRPLHLGSVRLLVGQCLGSEADEVVLRTCFALTRGNPFLLRTLLSAFRSGFLHPEASLPARQAVDLPEVARSINARLAHAPPHARTVLEAVALLGDQGGLREVAALADVEVDVASSMADALAEVHLLRRGRPLRFTYPLERLVVCGQMGTARLAQAHAQAARILTSLGAPPARVARHLLHVEPVGDPRAAHRLERAGRELLDAGQADLALRCFTRALAEPPADEQRPHLMAAQAAAEAALGLPATLVHVRQLADMGVEPATLVGVVTRYAASAVGDPYPPAAPELLASLSSRLATEPPELRLSLEVTRAVLSRPGPDLALAVAAIERLLGHRRSPRTRWESLASANLAFFDACSPGRASAVEVTRLARWALEAGEQGEVDGIWVRALARSLVALVHAGQFVVVDRLVQRAEEAVLRSNAELPVATFSAVRATSYLLQGALVEAEAESRRSLVATPVASWAPGRVAAVLLSASLLDQGRISEAENALGAGTPPASVATTLVEAGYYEQRARLRLAQGRSEEALEDLSIAGRSVEHGKVEQGKMVFPALPSWRITAVTALRQAGRSSEARRLARQELEWTRSFGAPGPLGAALRAAAGLSEGREQLGLLTESVEVLEGSGAMLESAASEIDLGVAFRWRGRLAAARRHLRQGADLAFRAGARPLANRAAHELRVAGARPRRLALTGPDSLTPAERRVAELAAAGMKNSRIAAELFVSERTVQGHLSRAYRKLGVHSRASLPDLLTGTRTIGARKQATSDVRFDERSVS